MKRGLDDYRTIVGDNTINSLFKKAKKLYGKHIVNINSTYYGGGVAELLNSLVPLLNDIGVDTDWRNLRGTSDFFNVTKVFHNALQSGPIHLTDMKKKLYLQTNEDFSVYCHINADAVIIHDPQPMPLIKFYKKRQPWIWRCHIDLSNPNEVLWDYLKQFLVRYDEYIISSEKYKAKGLDMKYRIINPAIDPLTSKNMDISDKVIDKYMKKFGIPTDKPLITQISRFDKWKDPEGVVSAFKIVKEKRDVRLVLCGSMATDDPEGQQIYERIRKIANGYIKNGDIILINVANDILVNALQRKSDVILQKSIREGFGLTVTEALWKARPVIASNVGGIALQIKNNETGFLVDPYDLQGVADKIIYILDHPKEAEEMGKKAKEFVRKNFLITRLVSDYLDLFNNILFGKIY